MSLGKSDSVELGLEITQEDIDDVRKEDWNFYLFWSQVKSVTLENLNRHGKTWGFGTGTDIIKCFEDTISTEEYSQKHSSYLEQVRRKHGFEEKITAEMYCTFSPYSQEIDSVLKDLEQKDTLNASTVRKMLHPAREAAEQRLETYDN